MKSRKSKGLLHAVKRIAVIVAGSAVLLVGLAMIVLPGPAIVVIPVGLSILGTEVPIAKRLVKRVMGWVHRGRRAFAANRTVKKLKILFYDRRLQGRA